MHEQEFHMVNYEVGEDENLKYEHPSPLLTSENYCQHQQMTANYSWKVNAKQKSQLCHHYEVDPLDLIAPIEDAALKIL